MPSSPLYPSKTFRYVLKRGMTGFEIAALQLLLNDVRHAGLVVDGVFGAASEKAVKAFQAVAKITVDGIAGVGTQTALGRKAIVGPSQEQNLPDGLLRGIVEGESGYAVGCVNWSVPPGVDCGLIQDRVFDPAAATHDRWVHAFGRGALDATAGELRARKDRFYAKAAVTTHVQAWELACLAHNWPAGADKLARGQVLSEQPAAWVTAIGVRGVTSPADWARFYIERTTALVPDNGWTP